MPPQKRMVSYEPERHDPPFPSWLVERPSMRAASVRGAGADGACDGVETVFVPASEIL